MSKNLRELVFFNNNKNDQNDALCGAINNNIKMPLGHRCMLTLYRSDRKPTKSTTDSHLLPHFLMKHLLIWCPEEPRR